MANTFKYRADHVGKLVPPPDGEGDLLQRLASMQRTAGVAVATDGELRRNDLPYELLRRGMSGEAPRLVQEEAAPLKGATSLPIKISLPSPSEAFAMLDTRAKREGGTALDPSVAGASLVKAVSDEANALFSAGVAYVQLNTTAYGDLLDNPERDEPTFKTLLAMDGAALALIKPPPAGRIALRIGRTIGTPWYEKGEAGRRAGALLSLPAQRFLLPFTKSVPPDFAVLKVVRQDADIVLGLADTRVNDEQSKDGVLSWLDSAAEIVDGDRLALSPRAGFGADMGVTWDIQRRQLEWVADVSTRFWGFAA